MSVRRWLLQIQVMWVPVKFQRLHHFARPILPRSQPVLQYMLRGIKRSPWPPARTRLPITLRTLKSRWSPHAQDTDYVMLWAACCVGFFGFLRAGEFKVRSQEDFDLAASRMMSGITVDRHECPSWSTSG